MKRGKFLFPAKCEGPCPKPIINSTLMNVSYKRRPNSCFTAKDEIRSNNSFCLPSFPMEVFASQPGSVESLRKANDIPGNSSTYRNLNQHCSACARVKKKKKEPCVNPDLQTQFLSMPPPRPSNWLCRATFTSNLNISWHLSHDQTHLVLIAPCHYSPLFLTFCPFIPTLLTWNSCPLFFPNV